MIRPITCICVLLACGSGLYLYQAKHRVQLLDRQIEDTVQAADKLREQSRVLHAEWTLLNDPQRLQTLADQFLTLRTVQPNQFVGMADLDSRLPPVPPPEPAPAAVPSEPVAEAPSPPPPQTEPTPAPAVAAAAPPPPPPPAKPVAVASTPAPRPPEHKPPPPHPVVAEVRPEPRLVHPVVATVTPRPAPPQPAAFAGSALGMARTAAPLPQPTPVNASQWVSSGNGGG